MVVYCEFVESFFFPISNLHIMSRATSFNSIRAVGARKGHGPPDFSRSINPISPGGQIMPTTILLIPPHQFSDFPTSLKLQ